MNFRFVSCLIFIAAAGCATPKFKVQSDPLQADVYYQTSPSADKKALGKTPFEMPLADFKHYVGDVSAGQYFQVIVEKKGFVPVTVTIPATQFGTMVTELNVKLKPGDQPQETRTAKQILDHLFLAQKLALENQFERAQIELDQILNDFPDFPRALSMRASIYFVQKNYAESEKWYEAALKADPKMEDAIKMLAKVRQAEGKRTPASTPGGGP